MPRRADLRRVLVIGSGPIVIGQACEFDYSGTQAVKALRADGVEVVLVNSNPATVMTDPELAERTYIEPLTPEHVEAVIARERPDAVLPTVGGQTALTLALALADGGVLARYGVEMIGARIDAIRVAEDRAAFKAAMLDIGLDVPQSALVSDPSSALAFAAQVGYPVVLRPSFTLGGSGGGIAYNAEECEEIARRGIGLSPVGEVLVEESLLGWKEYELEVVRDRADNVIVVCSIENFDPMGVHTGDSLTVAPAQTLTDREYQRMRDAAAAIMRRVGVDTGGSNVQFAVHPGTGRLVVIEMNPRVSRSSALASKATGFPIAKVAAKLALGYTLDELPNDITGTTPASFEPALDYVVTKIPKFAFEKFPGADDTLGTQMKSVGEVMAIGRTFRESLFKALRSLEAVRPWRPGDLSREEMTRRLAAPNESRLHVIVHALEHGWTVDELHALTHVDPWFLDQLDQFAEVQRAIRGRSLEQVSDALLVRAKQDGFSDRRIAHLTGAREDAVRARRHASGVRPVFKMIDTCAAEFASDTPYLYSTYEVEDECPPVRRRTVMILGSGPNRIGQGIEFDYCCCHAAFALRDAGVQSLMVNCNPETVSTDYDTSDRLYFEPLTLEDVLEIHAREKPDGVIVQFGGQTPLNLTRPLADAGVRILGTRPSAVDRAEDREQFAALLDELGLARPSYAIARTLEEAEERAEVLGYPLLVRPSYVLGGRGMAVVYDRSELQRFAGAAFEAAAARSVLLDRFLEDATEVDVDALSDGRDCIIAGVMEHIEEAGVHSGDSCCVLPVQSVTPAQMDAIRHATRVLAQALGVVGLMNVQLAISGGVPHVLEVNPRASRTVPFVAKATGVPLAKVATRLMLGESLRECGLTADLSVRRVCVKAPVFPFTKFRGADPALSPEMRSTGEVMGIADDFGSAYYAALLAAGTRLPTAGTAFVTVCERDHRAVEPIARRLLALGFSLTATRGTAAALRAAGLPVTEMRKVSEGRPHGVDALKSGEIALMINTPFGASSHRDGWALRTTALENRVPCVTTLAGAEAAVHAIEAAQRGRLSVMSLQEMHGAPRAMTRSYRSMRVSSTPATSA